MAVEYQIINKPVGTAGERTAWIEEYTTATTNQFALTGLAGVGNNLVAFMTKLDMNGGPGLQPAMRRTKKPKRKK